MRGKEKSESERNSCSGHYRRISACTHCRGKPNSLLQQQCRRLPSCLNCVRLRASEPVSLWCVRAGR